ncbi:PEP-CTERM sorting domain-containing protein [Aquincola sp. MAHUQ-54]|uniref:PEP-CTERM sorting domain-containing protein n=1 Tax=Aquincola agrisoli TaxID=3119538 RepID=A0AAW9QD14_9BURK
MRQVLDDMRPASGRPMGRATRHAVALAAATLLSTAAQAALVNGSFESGLQGWTVGNFFAEDYDYGIDALAHSGQAAFFGGGIGAAGTLSQTVATTPSQAYVLSFWLAGDGFMPNEFTVLANGAPLFQLSDAAFLSNTYQQFKVFLSPATASTSLSFAFRSDSGAFHFDDVALAPVPEPTTTLLFGAGIAALLAARKLRGRPSR